MRVCCVRMHASAATWQQVRKICTYFTVEVGRAVFKSPETYARLKERDVRARARASGRASQPRVFLAPATSPFAWHCIFAAFRKLLGKAPWPIIAIDAVTRLCALKQVAATAQLECISAACICVFPFFFISSIKRKERYAGCFYLPKSTGCFFNSFFLRRIQNIHLFWMEIRR